MKRVLRYLVSILILLICIYLFWLWLQYKGATVIKQTTISIMTELQTLEKLESASQTFSKTIEGENQLTSLLPDIGADKIISSALFKDKMILKLTGEVRAGYITKNIITGDIDVSRDGAVHIILGEPKIFGIFLTGETKSATSGIVTSSDKEIENKLREKAGEMMIQEALSGNILQEAKNNAQNMLQTLFLNAGIQIKEVIITGTGDIR